MSFLSDLLEEDMKDLELFVQHNVPEKREQDVVFHKLNKYVDGYKRKHNIVNGTATREQCVRAQIAWRTHINQYCWEKGYNMPYEAKKLGD